MLLTSLQFIQGGDTPSVSVSEGAPLLDGGTHFQAVLYEAQQQLDGSAATSPPSDSSGTPYPSLAELIAEFLAESDIPTSPETASDTREEAQNPEVDIPILPQSGHPPDVGPEPTGKNSTAQTVGPVEEAPPPIGEQLPPEYPAPVQTEHSVANAQPRSVQEHPATPAPEPERPSPSPSGQPSPPPIQEADWTRSNEPWTTLETHNPDPGRTAPDNQPVSPDPSNRTSQPMPYRQVVQPEVGSEVPAPTVPTPKPDLQPEGDLPATDMVRQPEVQPPVRNTGRTEVPQGPQTMPTPPGIQTSETPPSEPLEIGRQQVSNNSGDRSNTPVETIVSQNEPVVQVEIPETARIEGESPVRIDMTTGPSRPVSTPQGVEPGRVDMMAENLEETYRVTDQIVRSARLLSRNNTNQVTMRLDPPELGEVTVRLSSTGQVISGEIEVENQQVRDIVTRNMGSLREAFAREGIQIDQIEVSVDSRGGTDTPRDFSRPSSEDRENNPSPEDRQNQNRPSPEWEGPGPQQDLPQQDGGVDFLA